MLGRYPLESFWLRSGGVHCAWAMAAHSVTAPPDSSQQSAQASVGTALQLSIPFAPFHFLPSSRGVDPKSAPSEPGQTVPRAAGVLVKTAPRMLAQGLTPGGHHGGGSTGQCGVLLSVLDALCSWMLPLVAPVGPWPADLPQAHSLDMKAHSWQALTAATSTCTVLRAHKLYVPLGRGAGLTGFSGCRWSHRAGASRFS